MTKTTPTKTCYIYIINLSPPRYTAHVRLAHKPHSMLCNPAPIQESMDTALATRSRACRKPLELQRGPGADNQLHPYHQRSCLRTIQEWWRHSDLQLQSTPATGKHHWVMGPKGPHHSPVLISSSRTQIQCQHTRACYVFWALINSLVCWSYMSARGLTLFQICDKYNVLVCEHIAQWYSQGTFIRQSCFDH